MRNNLLNRVFFGAAFFAAFLILWNSPLADLIKLPIIFYRVVIPIFQWLLVFGFVLLWKSLTKERWKKVFAEGIILGLIFCIYLPMLDSLAGVWTGADLSRIYVVYINVFVFTVTLSLLAYGVFAIKYNAIFFPVLFLSLYGISFYYSSGRLGAALFLMLGFVLLFYASRHQNITGKVTSLLKLILSGLRNHRVLIAAIFVFALILRLVFLFNLLHIEGPNYPIASDDGDSYDAWGWKGVTDPMAYLRESPHYFWIFYSVFLTLIYYIFGHSYIAAGVIQSIIGAGLCCIIFIFSWRITKNTVVAFLAAFGVAIDSTLIHLTTTLNTEVLYIPFLVLVMLFLLFYKESPKDFRAILFLLLSGFILGLATIVRTTAIGVAALAFLWIAIWGRSYSANTLARRLRDGAIFIVLAVATVLPVTYVNYRNTGKFFLVYDTTRSMEWTTPPVGRSENLVPSNKRLMELGMKDPINDPVGAVKAVLARPKDFLKAYWFIIPRRIKNLYLWPNFGNFDPIFLMNPTRLPSKYASHLGFYSILLLITGVFIFIFADIKASFKALSLIMVAYYSLLHGVFFLSQSPRYGAPMRPFLYIAVSFGIYKILTLLQSFMSDKKEG